MAAADPLDDTAKRIIEAAVELYREQQGRADPDVYAYFDELLRELRRPS